MKLKKITAFLLTAFVSLSSAVPVYATDISSVDSSSNSSTASSVEDVEDVEEVEEETEETDSSEETEESDAYDIIEESEEESSDDTEASVFDEVTDEDVITEDETIVEPSLEAMDSETEMDLLKLLDDSYESLVNTYEITVPEGTEFPVTITFDADVESNDEIFLYHYLTDDNEWEIISPDLVEDGSITATFDSLSPVGVVKEESLEDTLVYQEFSETIDGVVIDVSGDIPEGYYLSVEVLNNSDYSDMIEEQTGNVVAKVYDITITDGENEYQPADYGNSLSVTFSGLDSVNEGKMNVVHIDEETEEVEQKSVTVDTMEDAPEVSFETDSFSPYALVLATSTLEIEEGVDTEVPFVDDYYGTSISTIYHMYLTYDSSTKEAFCLDHGLSASSGETFVQNGQYSSSEEVEKILTAYFADENGNGYTLSYAEAQVLVWAAIAGYTTSSDTDDDGVLDYVEIMQAIGDNDESTNETAVATIEAITTLATFYAWDPASTYDESSSTYTRDETKQRFITLLGKAVVEAADVDGDLWQVGDNAYAYIDSSLVFHITGYGDCWNQTIDGYYTSGRGSYYPEGEEVPYRNTTNYPSGAYTSIEVESEITGIGSYMFANTVGNYATSITFDGDLITYIGDYAFSASYIEFPETLVFNDCEYIGDQAFAYCTIDTIEINGDVTGFGRAIFYTTDTSHDSTPTTIIYNVANGTNVRTTTSGSSYNAPSFMSISNGITGTKTTTLQIGDNVESIPAYIFSWTQIDTIVNPTSSNWTTIGGYAFAYNDNLTEFTMPESLTTFSDSNGFILSGCKNITTIYHNATNLVYVVSGSTTYDSSVDEGSRRGGLSSSVYGNCGSAGSVQLIIGESVEALPYRFCNGMTYLVSVENNSSLITKYPSYTFSGCTALTGITETNSSITKFEVSVFANCTSLTSFDFTQYPSLTGIGGSCFYGTNIASIVIPDTVTVIGRAAFANNTSLTTIVLGSGIEYFCGNSISSSSVSGTSALLVGCTSLEAIYYNAANAKYSPLPSTASRYLWSDATVTGTFYNSESHTTTVLDGYTTDHDVTLIIGDTVESIGDTLFMRSDITSVDFSNASSLTSIGESAFELTFISEASFVEGLTSIGERAFANCPNLLTVTMPDSIATITETAFYLDTTQDVISAILDYDRDDDGTVDALTTTLNASDDNTVALAYAWLSSDNRYVANAIAYSYLVTLPMSLELTDPGDGVFVNELPVIVVVTKELSSPLSVTLTMGTFKNSSDDEWTLDLDTTSPSGTVQETGDYSFECVVSGTPPTDGEFTGSITCTVTE